MGVTAENVAEKYGITREVQDKCGYDSQMNAWAAIQAGKFKDEIVPVEIPSKKGVKIFDTDEHVRPETTLEGLASLKPAFKKDGTVTAGNASGINDSGSALVIASREWADAHGIKPLATIVGGASAALDPAIMGMGPYYATKKVLAKTGLTLDEIELIEANEAFAAQCCAVAQEIGFDMSKVNKRGGAIALGHPIGASGGRILTTPALCLEAGRQASGSGYHVHRRRPGRGHPGAAGRLAQLGACDPCAACRGRFRRGWFCGRRGGSGRPRLSVS